MSTSIVRRFAPVTGALLILLAACGGTSDLVGKDKLQGIKEGTKLADVVTSIGEGPLKPIQPGDSVRLHHGYRVQEFFASGDRYKVIWYREKAGNVEEAITRQNETPILLHADTVMGTGWNYFDEKAEKLGIPNPMRDAARLDSIAKSQQPKKN